MNNFTQKILVVVVAILAAITCYTIYNFNNDSLIFTLIIVMTTVIYFAKSMRMVERASKAKKVYTSINLQLISIITFLIIGVIYSLTISGTIPLIGETVPYVAIVNLFIAFVGDVIMTQTVLITEDNTIYFQGRTIEIKRIREINKKSPKKYNITFKTKIESVKTGMSTKKQELVTEYCLQQKPAIKVTTGEK